MNPLTIADLLPLARDSVRKGAGITGLTCSLSECKGAVVATIALSIEKDGSAQCAHLCESHASELAVAGIWREQP